MKKKLEAKIVNEYLVTISLTDGKEKAIAESCIYAGSFDEAVKKAQKYFDLMFEKR